MFVVVSGLGALNGWTLLAGEVSRTMAINGVLPIPLAQVNRRGAPALALVVTGVLASAMVLMNYSRSLVAGFSFLSLMVTAACLPLYLPAPWPSSCCGGANEDRRPSCSWSWAASAQPMCCSPSPAPAQNLCCGQRSWRRRDCRCSC